MGEKPNLTLGILFLAIGLITMLVIDPWFVGLVFILIGAHRMYVGLTIEDGTATNTDSDSR